MESAIEKQMNINDPACSATTVDQESTTAQIRWEHTHQCKKCGHVVPIDELDSRVITLGLITCPKCEISGPINVAIVQIK